MKPNIGDLVALQDISNWMNPRFRLGYIESINKWENGGYFIYFFDIESSVWYSEDYVNAFKENLNNLNRFDGRREIDWKPANTM